MRSIFDIPLYPLRVVIVMVGLVCPWGISHGATDGDPIGMSCEAAIAAAGHDPNIDPFEADPVPLELLDSIGSACGDLLFWMAVPQRLAQGDVRGAVRDWTLALARASLLRTVHPKPATPDGYALYGALASTFGPHMHDVIHHDPSLSREATAEAIAQDLIDPSIALPPELHPEAYADMRASLAERLEWLDELVAERASLP